MASSGTTAGVSERAAMNAADVRGAGTARARPLADGDPPLDNPQLDRLRREIERSAAKRARGANNAGVLSVKAILRSLKRKRQKLADAEAEIGKLRSERKAA